jgi:hypothetical protein
MMPMLKKETIDDIPTINTISRACSKKIAATGG